MDVDLDQVGKIHQPRTTWYLNMAPNQSCSCSETPMQTQVTSENHCPVLGSSPMVSLFPVNPPADFPMAVFSLITLVNIQLYQSIHTLSLISATAVHTLYLLKKKQKKKDYNSWWCGSFTWAFSIPQHAFVSLFFFLFITFTACANAITAASFFLLHPCFSSSSIKFYIL